MNYIINPMWFYWMNIANNLGITCTIVLILGSVAAVALTIIYTTNKCEIEKFPNISANEQAKNALIKKFLKPLYIIVVMSLIGALFIPSSETMLKMLLAQFATYDNAEIALDGIQSAADYIVNAMKEIGGI